MNRTATPSAKHLALALLSVSLFGATAMSQEEPFDLKAQFGDGYGFAQGSVDGQRGWEVLEGDAVIEGNLLKLSSDNTHVRWAPEVPLENELLTVKVSMHMVMSQEDNIIPVARIHGVEIAILSLGYARTGTLLVADGEGGWIEASMSSSSDALTVRFDRRGGRAYFDVGYFNAGISVVDRPIPGGAMPAIEFFGHPEGESQITEIQITTALGVMPPDRDDDGLNDQWEGLNGISTQEDSRMGDPDADGLANVDERKYKTDPQLVDTDFDGVSDADEVLAGTDPTKGRWPNVGVGRVPYEPTDEDIRNNFHFRFLVPEGVVSTAEQRVAILDTVQALWSSEESSLLFFATAFDGFLAQFPDSPYVPWINTLKANWYYEAGEWTAAKPLLEQVWEDLVVPDFSDYNSLHAYQTIGLSLASIYTMERNLEAASEVLARPGMRDFSGGHARWELHLTQAMQLDDDGLMYGYRTRKVLAELLRALSTVDVNFESWIENQDPAEGISLQYMADRAATVGVSLRVAYREPGSELIEPAIMLSKFGFFTFIQKYPFYDDYRPEAPDRPRQRFELVPETIDRESTGYFLISADTELPEGWRWADAFEAEAQIGDRRIVENSVIVAQRNGLELQAPQGMFHESALIKFKGAPGQYTLEYASELAPESFQEVESFELTEEIPTASFAIESLELDLEAADEGYFRIR